ncbi:MAG: protein kinase domain-containing protein [bacterium]
MIGQTGSHYKILAKLGEGGMGLVYKAQDLKLDRFVALKFLPHALVTNKQEKMRFMHEAKAASALDHPNICTIHEVDETGDGQMFIVMGYYEGETLQKKVDSGLLAVDRAIDVAIQIAQGVGESQARGVQGEILSGVTSYDLYRNYRFRKPLRAKPTPAATTSRLRTPPSRAANNLLLAAGR